MADSNSSLLFIPDISGFTRFVQNTEIEHSQHIIAELLELLIDADELGMVVSEIEGDAVLFYKQSEMPTPEALIAQAKRMFVSFHTHLAQYDKNRICDCGACSTANRLTLKIIAHQGTFGLIKVKEFRKPYGSDVILAHRLMKNEIDDSEYLLLTQEIINGLEQQQLKEQFPWASLHEGSSTYDELGPVPYAYLSLSPLHDQVMPAREADSFEPAKDPIVQEIHIDAPMDAVYKKIIDFEARIKWSPGVQEITFPESRINRIGSSHTCVLPVGKLAFETISTRAEPESRAYAEKISIPFIRELINAFEIFPEGGGVKVKLSIHIHAGSGIGQLAKRFLKPRLAKSTAQSLQALKDLCEQEHQYASFSMTA